LSHAELTTWAGLKVKPSLPAGFGPSVDISCIHAVTFAHLNDRRVGQGGITGRFVVPSANWGVPEQMFVEDGQGADIVLRGNPGGKWPRVCVKISRESAEAVPRCEELRVERADGSVEAWLLFKRFMFLLQVSGRLLIVEDNAGPVELWPKPDSEWSQNLRNLSSVIRKIAYIQSFFNEQFLEFSEGVSQESLLAIELIFRAITEGEFAIRSSEITFRRLSASKLNLNKAPFTGPGMFSRSCEENSEHMTQSLLGKELYLGPFSIRIEKSEIANRRVLDNIAGNLEGPVDIKFVVYDHQVSYRFDRYAGDKHREE